MEYHSSASTLNYRSSTKTKHSAKQETINKAEMYVESSRASRKDQKFNCSHNNVTLNQYIIQIQANNSITYSS